MRPFLFNTRDVSSVYDLILWILTENAPSIGLELFLILDIALIIRERLLSLPHDQSKFYSQRKNTCFILAIIILKLLQATSIINYFVIEMIKTRIKDFDRDIVSGT